MNRPKLIERLVPLDLIFASGGSMGGNRPDAAGYGQYASAPLVTIDPYMEAIRSASKGEPVPESFHEFESERTGKQEYDRGAKEKKLRSRLRGIGRLLPGDHPVVEDIVDDRLLVNEGLLDACIAKLQGKEWVKVAMPQDVAERWDSRPTTQLDAVCKAQQRTQIYTPIMHPAYRKFEYSRRGRARLDMMRRYLGPNVAGMSLLDVGCNCGYYVFHFRRQGMATTGIDVDKEHLAIAEAQAPMYHLDVELKNVSLRDVEFGSPYDVVLTLSVIWHILGWGKMPAAMSETELTAKLDQMVGECLFWESGPEPDREIDLIRGRTGLVHFKPLGTTSATGIGERVFGVFTRGS